MVTGPPAGCRMMNFLEPTRELVSVKVWAPVPAMNKSFSLWPTSVSGPIPPTRVVALLPAFRVDELLTVTTKDLLLEIEPSEIEYAMLPPENAPDDGA